MKEQFFATLEKHFRQNLDGVTPLQKAIREKAWERFCQLGLPEKKHVGYQYFPFTQFYKESFDLAAVADVPREQINGLIYPESRHSHFIFVNGQYCPELSDISGLPEKVVALRLRDALHNYGNFLQTRMSGALKDEDDPFATLNIALIQMGLFFYVPPKTVIDTPIQCLHLISHDRGAIYNPRIHCFLGKESKVKWIYDHHCVKDFEYISNGVSDFVLEEGAHFEQYEIIKPCIHGWVLSAVRATLKKNSTFKYLTCTTGSRCIRKDFRISLIGENASADLKGISLLRENRQAHVNVLMDHVAPHCQSNQLFKNILMDSSRSSFEGKILVQSPAQKTEAYQLNHNLLLNDKAIANSKPNLEVFADDVKASHGATVTQLNPEHLHYLKTRGIDAETAKNLLLTGFSLDILQSIPDESVRDRILHFAEKYLS